MKLNFRQGVVRHQTDVHGNPTFLQRSAGGGQFVDLIVSPDPTTLSFAHRSATYILDELKTVQNAWGPLVGAGTKYLYWDMNLLNGALTRGITLLPPLYTSAAPLTPQPDQYWFDTVDLCGRVWNGKKWVEALRVFAGYVTSNAIVHPAGIGSAAGLIGPVEGGYVVLDSLGNPLRQSDGTFVSTVSWLNVVNLGTTTTRLEEAVMSGMAAEELPKYSLVQIQKGRRLKLARSTDHRSRISGIITTDMYEGEVDTVISNGVVKNDEWSFTEAQINRPIFCGPTGQVTLIPPQQGVLQQVGFVFDVNSIFMEPKQVVVLDSPEDMSIPPAPAPVTFPIANFTMSATSGIGPLTVNFTNTSLGGQQYEWDFTNDGFIDSTAANPSYVFSTPGTYTVRLKATNTFGFDEEIKSNVITVTRPNSGPLNTNLGLSFGAPTQINSGATFSFQVITTNDGLANATLVNRVIKLRTNNGSAVQITASPTGTVITKNGPITIVTLPAVSIDSGAAPAIAILSANTAASATAIQIDGVVTSPETDATPQDNTASLTVAVRP